ncbi:cobalamin biosynthesis protein [Streptomyces sp. NBC_01197]|uniref:cobalamin biosynthesis protein n=1 Tax=Streptomyces sp. NBC_01197 TaxID=2903768 RepID=UPI002E146A2C|nr:cobalamin biosynthesis protein [Streptomyces sp. NBC_01197]
MSAARPGPARAPAARAQGPGPDLVVGVGASRGVRAGEVAGLIAAALRDAGLSPLDVAELATVETRAAEPGLVAAAVRLGVPLRPYSAAALARIVVPHPSDRSRAAVGTPSVAEAAALAAGGQLLVPKRKSAPRGRPAMATCAVVRREPQAPGPGHRMTPPGGTADPGLPQQPHVHPDDERHHLHHHGSHAPTH